MKVNIGLDWCDAPVKCPHCKKQFVTQCDVVEYVGDLCQILYAGDCEHCGKYITHEEK